MAKQTTENLTVILRKMKPDQLDEYFSKYAECFMESEIGFTTYMRSKIREKGKRQKDVFIAADLSDSYGYKLISRETLTLQRDVIFKLCMAAHFSLEETQEALSLYGMPELSPKVKRDCVLIVAVNNALYESDVVNKLLRKYCLDELYTGKGEE